MANAKDYRHYAAECMRLAQNKENLREKDLMVQMAEHWRQLAERAEEAEKNANEGKKENER
ncbi:MAG: hypothetical protein WBF58_03880 [Xanthobacteraceae bacterium]